MKKDLPRRKLTILHVGNHTFPCVGGIENVIWQSAREQVKLGHTVHVMVFNTCTQGKELPAEETIDGVRVHRVPQKGFSFYRIPPKEELLTLARACDIIHIHGVGAWLDILSQNKSTLTGKLVLTTHGGFFHTPKRKWLKKWYASFWLPRAWKKLDGISYVSPSDKENFSFLPQEKTTIFLNGIEDEYFQLSLDKKQNGLFLFVGRLSTNKRVDRLIETFSHFVRMNDSPGATLHVVGKDWEGIQHQLEKMVQEKGLQEKIFFHGEVSPDQKREWLEKASVFVSASEYEGFGISVVEGMAAGCIPCVNDIPPFKMFVDEERGGIVDYADPHAAAQKWTEISHYSATKIKTMRARARAYAHTLSWKKIVAEQVEWYYSLRSN